MSEAPQAISDATRQLIDGAGYTSAAKRSEEQVELARSEIKAALLELGAIADLDEQQAATVESAKSSLHRAIAAVDEALGDTQ